jgi:DNA-binding XRE family transcriptional regulator
MSVKILERNGRPAFAVLPIEEYDQLLEALEDARDAARIEDFHRRLVAGEEEVLPVSVVDQILDGENPVAVLRKYRGATLQALADACGVTNSHISQIEKGKRSMSTEVLKKMAEALRVDVELIL